MISIGFGNRYNDVSYPTIVSTYHRIQPMFCSSCESVTNVEQKINGVIKYLPIGKDALIEEDRGS